MKRAHTDGVYLSSPVNQGFEGILSICIYYIKVVPNASSADDIVHNTLGAIIGVSVFVLIKRLVDKKRNNRYREDLLILTIL